MKQCRLLALLVSVFFVAACSSSGSGSRASGDGAEPVSGTSTPDIWEAFRARPLRLPRVAPGAACPRTPGEEISAAFGPALGDGPVYPVGLGAEGVLSFVYPPDPRSGFAGSEWGGQKVLWVSSPAYQGPALIRGRQVDGPNELRFERGVNPPDELRLAEEGGAVMGEPGWRQWPSYTRLRAPGCYAYQVDGLDFSYVVIFEAVVAR